MAGKILPACTPVLMFHINLPFRTMSEQSRAEGWLWNWMAEFHWPVAAGSRRYRNKIHRKDMLAGVSEDRTVEWSFNQNILPSYCYLLLNLMCM